MSEQNETGAPADGAQMTVWDAIRSRRDVRGNSSGPGRQFRPRAL
jgi:hypothetical protein